MSQEPDSGNGGLSRREALKLAGAVGVVGAVAGSPGQAFAHGSPSAAQMRRRAAVASSPRAVVATTGSAHPLESLSSDEIMSTFALIEGDARFPSGAVFPIVQLKEPPKREVLGWSAGKRFRREAFANVYPAPTNKLYEVIVDLAGKRIASWQARPGLQPSIYNPDEYNAEDALVRADPRWVAAMKGRGLNPDDVNLDGWAPPTDTLSFSLRPSGFFDQNPALDVP